MDFVDLLKALKAFQERCAEEADAEAARAQGRINSGSPLGSDFNRGCRRGSQMCAQDIRNLDVDSWLIARAVMHGTTRRVVELPVEHEARVKRLELALQFYANEQNWGVPGVVRHRMFLSSTERDSGAIARTALEPGAWVQIHPTDGSGGTAFFVGATDLIEHIVERVRGALHKSRKETG